MATTSAPAKSPQREHDPRALLEPNFSYDQEDYLRSYCKAHGIGRNICTPSFILGAMRDGQMNVCFPVGVYATVSAYLMQPMQYPGGLAGYEEYQDQSSSRMHGYFEGWGGFESRSGG